mgnify:CR=1 FL=1
MTVEDMIKTLQDHNPHAILRFSIANDASEDPSDRWFCEDGIEACFGNWHGNDGIEHETEVTVCLVVNPNQ